MDIFQAAKNYIAGVMKIIYDDRLIEDLCQRYVKFHFEPRYQFTLNCNQCNLFKNDLRRALFSFENKVNTTERGARELMFERVTEITKPYQCNEFLVLNRFFFKKTRHFSLE